jgi:hypothetical protein
VGGGERGRARLTFNGWEHVVQESKHERSPRHCQSTATSIVSSLCTRPPNLGLLDSNSSSLPSLVALPAWTVSSYSPLDGQEDEVPPVLRVCKVLDGTGDIQQPERVGERRECDGVEQRCYRSRYEDHLGWRREDGMRRERSRRCLDCSTVHVFAGLRLAPIPRLPWGHVHDSRATGYLPVHSQGLGVCRPRPREISSQLFVGQHSTDEMWSLYPVVRVRSTRPWTHYAWGRERTSFRPALGLHRAPPDPSVSSTLTPCSLA